MNRKYKGKGECWIYAGARNKDGYPKWRKAFLKGEKFHLAYRVIYEKLIEPVSQGLVLDHLCRNKLCVNPDHLEPVTCRENILRGEGFAAVNAKKQYCLKGHSYSKENTGNWDKTRRHRQCKTCSNTRQKLARRKKHENN